MAVRTRINIVGFIAISALLLMALCLTGCGRSSNSGALNSSSSSSSSSSKPTTNNNNPATEAIGLAEDVVESKFVGEWVGAYYYITNIDILASGDPDAFADNVQLQELSGSRYSQFNLKINSTGSASYNFNMGGESGFESNLKLEPGRTGSGYVVYDRQGNQIGDIEYGMFSDGSGRVTYFEYDSNGNVMGVECVRK